MEGLLFTLLGAALSITGGYLAHRWSAKHDQRKEDRALLYEAQRRLLDYYPVFKRLKDSPGDLRCLGEEVRFRDDLSGIALRINSKEHCELAAGLIQFVLDKPFRTDTNLHKLTRDCQMAVNSSVINKYEGDTREIIWDLKQRMLNQGVPSPGNDA